MKKVSRYFVLFFALSSVGYAQKIEWARYVSNASTNCIAISLNDSLIIVGTSQGQVLAVDRYSQNQVWSFDFGKNVNCVDLSRDGTRLLVAGASNTTGNHAVLLKTGTGELISQVWTSTIDTERVSQALFSSTDSVAICTNMGYYLIDNVSLKAVFTSAIGQILITPDYRHAFFYNTTPIYDASAQKWYGVLQDLKASSSCRIYGVLYGDLNDIILPRHLVVSPDGSKVFASREIFDAHTGTFDTSVDIVSGDPVFLSNNRFAYITYESWSSSQTNILIIRDLQTHQIVGRLDSVITIPMGLLGGQLIASNDGNSVYWNSTVLERIDLDPVFTRTVYTTEILSNTEPNGYDYGFQLIWYPSVLLDSTASGSKPVLFGSRPDGIGARNALIDLKDGSLSYLNSNWLDYAPGQRMIYGSRVLDLQTGRSIPYPSWNGIMSPDDSTFVGLQGIDSIIGVTWHYTNHGMDSVPEYHYTRVANVYTMGVYTDPVPKKVDTVRTISYSLIDFSRDGRKLLAADSQALYTIDPATFQILNSVAFPNSNRYYSQASDRFFAYDEQDSTLYSISVSDISVGTGAIVKRQMPTQINRNFFCDATTLFVTTADGWSALDPTTLQPVESEVVQGLVSFAISPDHQHAMTLSKDGILQYLQTALQPLSVKKDNGKQWASLISFPNPASGSMRIVFSLAEASRVSATIYNDAGSILARVVSGYLDAGSGSLEIPLTNYLPGSYFARLTEEGDASHEIGVCSFSVK